MEQAISSLAGCDINSLKKVFGNFIFGFFTCSGLEYRSAKKKSGE